MNDTTGLEPILAVAAIGIPLALVAVLGLGWAESWRDRRRQARAEQASLSRTKRNSEHHV
jgi:hypothetical protein